MHSISSFMLLAAASLAGQAVQAMRIPMLESRAPHFASILSPSEPLLLANSSDVNTTFVFTYRNGERADETTADVSLVNDTGSYLIAQGLQFIDNWYTINTTISIVNADFADGNYSLLVSESFDGQSVSNVTVPLTFSRNANATAASPITATSSSQTAYWGTSPSQTPDAVAANAQPDTSSVSMGRLASALAALTQI